MRYYQFDIPYDTLVYSSAQLRTVTVYHTDIHGIVGFDNFLNGDHSYYLPGLKNLRGYAPQELMMLHFHSTQDSSLNTLNVFVNRSSLSGLIWVDLMSGDAAKIKFNFERPLIILHSLTTISLNTGSRMIPFISDSNNSRVTSRATGSSARGSIPLSFLMFA